MAFKSQTELDGIAISISVDGTSVTLQSQDMAEPYHFSCVNAQLLATTLYAAIAEIEEGDKL